MNISNLTARNMADEITALLEAGAGAPVLKIYDENAAGIPSEVGTAISTQLLLVTIPMNTPLFPAAMDGAPGGLLTLDVTPIPEANAVANATASPTLFARLEDSNGVEHIQFDTVSTTSGDIVINSLAIASGAAVQVTAGSFTVPES